MKRFTLKIFGLVIVILAIGMGVWFFGPDESAEPEPAEEQGRIASQTEPVTAQSEVSPAPAPAGSTFPGASEFQKLKAAQVRNTAESLIALYRNPTSPDAPSARQSLLRLPDGLSRGHNALGKEAISQFLTRRNVQKPEELPQDTSHQPHQQRTAVRAETNIEAAGDPGV